MRFLFCLSVLFSVLGTTGQVAPPCLKAVRAQDAPYMPTGPYSIARADFNADGNVDFAITKSNSPEINVILGDGSGIYDAGIAYTQANVMGHIVTADFNGDGKADLATANTTGDDVSVYLGSGTGTFSPPLNLSAVDNPLSLCALDYNNDGHPDLAVANSGTNIISLFLNNGAGSFTGGSPVVVTSTNCAVRAVHVISSDFNADGKADLAMYSSGLSGYCNELYVLLGNGAGSFSKTATFGTGGGIAGLIAEDYNQDGNVDIAFSTGFFLNPNNMYYLNVLYGNGSGGFPNFYSIQSTDGPRSLINGDFDDDGLPDIAMANYDENKISLYLNAGNGTFPGNIVYAVASMPLAMDYVDVNHDTRKDLIILNHYSSTLNSLLSSGFGWFSAPRSYHPGTGISWGKAVLGDLDNNGLNDLAFPVGTSSSSAVGVMWGTGTGTFLSATQLFSVTGGASAITVADFDNNGSKDIAVVDSYNSVLKILAASTPGSFVQKVQTFSLNPAATFIDHGDFNGDGLNDLVIASKSTSVVSVMHNNGNASFATVYTYTLPGQPYGIAVGDFNGDGLKDVAASIFNPGLLCVMKSLGSGNFAVSTHTYFPNPLCGSEEIVTGYFNGDNKADIAIVSYNCGVHVFTCNPSGTPSVVATYSTGSGAYAISTSDFNGDGKTDLVVADYVYGQMTVHSGKGDGSFEEGILYETGNYVDGVVAGDLSGDNAPDILLNSGEFLLVLNAGAPSITITPSSNNVCEGTPVALTAEGGSTYTWSTGSTGSVVVVSPTITTAYLVSYFNNSGCGYAGASVTVNVLSYTPAVLGGLKNPVCADDAVLQLTGSPPGGSFSGLNVVGTTFVPEFLGTSAAKYTYTDANNCTHEDLHTVTVDECLGVEEEDEQAFTIFPNPVNSSAIFFTNRAGVLYIYSYSGALVLETEVKEGQNAVDCTHLEKGLYIVNARCGARTFNTKLIKY